ncbi:MAG TPA: hypothetical protein VLG16_04260 [Candidatus Saccharimonadales bacterium]|nr:hypothetical protein [Candidatus Saccharimonadales bacterium]
MTEHHIQMTAMASQASRLINGIDHAPNEGPVNLDVVNGDPSFRELFRESLSETDALYAKHREVFMPKHLESGSFVGSRHYSAILELSKEIVNSGRELRQAGWAGFLGVGAVQFAAAGAALAKQPASTFALKEASSEPPLPKQLIEIGTNLTEHVLSEIGERLYGNIVDFPTGRLYYPGHLAAKHLAFWQETLNIKAGSPVPPEIPEGTYETVQKLWPRFLAKHHRFDVDSALGRLDSSDTREIYVQAIKTFEESLLHPATKGVAARGNITTATTFALQSLDAFRRAGFSAQESMRLVVLNSQVIGRLTLRSGVGFHYKPTEFTLDERYDDYPRLKIGHFEQNAYDDPAVFSPRSRATLKRRDEAGGRCPVRDVVRLTPGGETHNNLHAFSEAIEEETGAKSPFLQEHNDEVYADIGTQSVAYGLYIIAKTNKLDAVLAAHKENSEP